MFLEKSKMTKIKPRARLRTFTLGCKVNSCDTNALVDAALAGGLERAPKGVPADVVVVNTCAVTARSVAKARSLLRRVRSSEPSALVLVTGCAVRNGDASLLEMPEADHFSATLEDALEYMARRFDLEPASISSGFEPARTRAFVKVQDGCDSFCSYCIVPFVRGAPKSTGVDEALAMIAKAVEEGYREIVLSGIHLGRYGRDLGGATLETLLEKVAGMDGDFRVRLSSIEPLEVTGGILDVMAASERFCLHLHLPLQSGSNRILSAMNRPYSMEEFIATVEKARGVLDRPAITTDIIVGFPGETEEEYNETLEAAMRIGFARAHVFVFSPREGTAAALLEGRVDVPTARRRSRLIRDAAAGSAAAFRKALIGETLEVLPETWTKGTLEGFSSRYQKVVFPGKRELVGTLQRIYIIGEDAGALRGTLTRGNTQAVQHA